MSRMRQKRKKRAREAAAAAEAAAVAEAAADAEVALDDNAESEAAEAAAAEAEEVAIDDDDAEPEAVEAAGEEGESGDAPEELDPARLKSVIESLLFVADVPLSVSRMRALTRAPNNKLVATALEELMADYDGRGIVLYKVGGGFQFRSHAANSEWVQKLVVGKPVRLTRAQLETLAIIAYRQPITRPEIDDIRGVDSGGTLRLLLDRDLIRVLGKKEEPGRPLLYGTTPDFLEFFNLNDLRDLPTLTEYSELSPESLEEVERLAPAEEEEAEAEAEAETEAESEDETGTEAEPETAAIPPHVHVSESSPETEETL